MHLWGKQGGKQKLEESNFQQGWEGQLCGLENKFAWDDLRNTLLLSGIDTPASADPASLLLSDGAKLALLLCCRQE